MDNASALNAPVTNGHLPRGVVGVVVVGGDFLVIRRALSVQAPGKVCFPGGGLEPGESEWDALVREFREELSLDIRPVGRVWECHTWNNVRLGWWQAVFCGPTCGLPDVEEVDTFSWIDPDRLVRDPDLLPTNRRFLSALRAGAVRLIDS